MIENLTTENIFLTIAISSTIFFVLRMIIFMIIGGDAEISADFDSIAEVDTSFTFLSVQSVSAFCMGFGWCGLAALKQFELSQPIIYTIAVLIGFICMFLSAYLMFSIKKLNKKVVIDINELVDTEGKAYTDFEPNCNGKIEIILNKKLTILEAINSTDTKIESFSKIKVLKIDDKKIYVTKI